MTTYLVTGATGGYGAKVLEFLAQEVDKKDIYALVRSEEKGAALKEAGFNIRIGDYTDKASLVTAFSGIDKLLLVSGADTPDRAKQHKNAIDAAKEVGVSYIAYTSLAGLQTVAANFPLGDAHRETEEALAESGLAYTALRHNWYLENELGLINTALKTGKFVHYAGQAHAGWVSRNDLAEVGAKVLVSDNPKTVLELSGANQTYADLYTATKEATGADIELVEADEQAVVDNYMAVGIPQDLATLFASFQGAVAGGFLTAEQSDLEEVLGRPQTAMVDSLKELLQ